MKGGSPKSTTAVPRRASAPLFLAPRSFPHRPWPLPPIRPIPSSYQRSVSRVSRRFIHDSNRRTSSNRQSTHERTARPPLLIRRSRVPVWPISNRTFEILTRSLTRDRTGPLAIRGIVIKRGKLSFFLSSKIFVKFFVKRFRSYQN